MKKVLSFVLSLAMALSGICYIDTYAVQADTNAKQVVSIKDEAGSFKTNKEITVMPLSLCNALTGGWDKDKDYSVDVGYNGDYVAFVSDSCGSSLDQYNLSFNAKSAVIKDISSDVKAGGTFTIPTKIKVYRLGKGEVLGSDAEGKQIYKDISVVNPKTGQPVKKSTRYDYGFYEEVYTVDSISGALEGSAPFSNNDITVVLPDSVINLSNFAKGNPRVGRVYGKEVTGIGTGAFQNCTNLTDVYFPNCKVIDGRAFYGCVSLGKQGDKLTDIQFPVVHSVGDSAFLGCTSLVKVNLGTTLQTLGNSAFEGCVSIEDIDLTGGTASGGQGTNTISTIPNKCFSGCTNLKNIKITERLVNIGDNAFYQCDMRDFKFENTKLQKIGRDAFSGCLNLGYASLPDTVTEVGSNAFSNCYNLRYLYSINPDIKDDVVSDLYTVLQKGVKDDKGGIVSRGSSYLDIDKKQIYSGGEVKITDDMNDIDINSVVVKKNGSVYITSDKLTECYDTRTVSKGTKGYKFNIEQGAAGYGSYEVEFSDVVGNKRVVTFDYKTDAEDVTAPEITVEGKTIEDDVYQSPAKVVCTDDLGIDKILVNEESMEKDTFELKEDDTYNITVIDGKGNSVSKVITIDSEEPEIEGIKSEITDRPFKITVTDDNLYKVFLNDEDITDEVESGYQINISNAYTVKAIDKAGNTAKVSFIYSANGAKVNAVKDGGIYNKDVHLTWFSLVEITQAKLKLNRDSDIDIESGYTCTEDGEYSLEIRDELNKIVRIRFEIDKTAPVITEVKNGGYYRNRVYLKPEDKNRCTLTENGKVVNDGFTEERTYNIKVTDKAGNSTSVKFTIDNTAPEMSVADKSAHKKGKKIKFKDKSGLKSAVVYRRTKKSGKWSKFKTFSSGFEMKCTKTGFYKVVMVDNSGLKSTRYFTIDNTKPKTNVKKGKTYKYGFELRFSDKQSGVKVAKLNGREISEGTRLTYTGSNKLTVTDFAGNKTSVKFRVK